MDRGTDKSREAGNGGERVKKGGAIMQQSKPESYAVHLIALNYDLGVQKTVSNGGKGKVEEIKRQKKMRENARRTEALRINIEIHLHTAAAQGKRERERDEVRGQRREGVNVTVKY